MKRCLTIILVLVVIFIVMFLCMQPASTVVSSIRVIPTYYVNSSGSLNVRSEPQITDKNIIGKLYYADMVPVYEIKDGWATITYNDSTAYVKEEFLTIDKPIYFEANSNLSSTNIANLKVQAVGYLSKKTNYYTINSKKMSGKIPEGLISIFAITNGYAYVARDRTLYKIKVGDFETIDFIGSNLDICNEPIIATYTTFFSTSKTNRVNNISLGAAAMQKVLAPGEIYSFNETVGERTSKKGYLLANAYAYGQIIEAYGGGVCQLSSTLYAAVRQDPYFSIIKRSAHNPEVTYLPLDMDATVNWNNVDFAFQNGYPFTVKVEAHIYNGMMTVLVRRILQY